MGHNKEVAESATRILAVLDTVHWMNTPKINTAIKVRFGEQDDGDPVFFSALQTLLRQDIIERRNVVVPRSPKTTKKESQYRKKTASYKSLPASQPDHGAELVPA